MKKSKSKIITLIITPILALILITTISLINTPSKIYLQGDGSIPSIAPLGNFMIKNEEKSDEYQIKFLGMIPLKSVKVQKVNDLKLYPGGIPVGVRVNSQGVLVVGYSDILVDDKRCESPGRLAGIQVGDIIMKVDGIEVENTAEVLKTIKKSDKGYVKLDILRHGKSISKKVDLGKEMKNDYKIGLWIRDSTAGVGTLTFLDTNTDRFGALGHPITDCDTNEMFTIKDGDILTSNIISVRRGEKGSPGELKGVFIDEDKPNGKISKNTQSGIFGEAHKLKNQISSLIPLDVGFRDEITEGDAKIITTIDENGPQIFNIKIEKLLSQDVAGPKSMMIRITDEKLLEKTGGIVQGMSGSPIVQNNKIVGAVTHVLVNKPDTGYGIYIEWMLEDAGIIQ